MSYAKLFSSIIHSTIWREPATTKVVWITMLAMANRKGVVESSIPGLADAAKVTLEECQAALVKISAPDEWSRTKEYDGRRIQEIDGGWLILNYEKHRATTDQEDIREKARERARRSRASRSSVTQFCDSHAQSQKVTLSASPAPAPEPTPTPESVVPTSLRTPPEQPSSASALAKVEPVEAEVISWSRAACDDWIARFGGTAPGGQIGKALLPIVKRHGWEFVRKAWCRYLAQTEAQYASPQRFSATFGRWSGLAPDPPPKDDVTSHNERVLADYMRGREDGGLGGAVKSMPKLRG